MNGKQTPLSVIVGAPLHAAIEAQASAASASVDFIRQLAFESAEEGGSTKDAGQVRKLVFYFDQPRGDGGTQQAHVEVPLITLVPLPYVRIEEVIVDFKVSLSAAEPRSATHAAIEGTEGSPDYLSPDSRVQIVAQLSSKRDSLATQSSRYAVETTMDFHLRAIQDDIPSGMQHLLSILSEAIQVHPTPPVAIAAASPSPP